MTEEQPNPIDERPKWSNRDKILVAIIAGILILVGIGQVSGNGKKSPSTNNTAANTSTSSGTIPVDNSTATTNTQPQQPTCTTYQAIDSQTWLEVVKDPDSYNGQCYTVYGEVTQFDSATGTTGFRADVGGVEQTPSYGFVDYPTNTVLVGSASTLSSVVEQDLFTANVMVLGSYTYKTQTGGQTTVPQLQVDSIQVTGSLSS